MATPGWYIALFELVVMSSVANKEMTSNLLTPTRRGASSEQQAYCPTVRVVSRQRNEFYPHCWRLPLPRHCSRIRPRDFAASQSTRGTLIVQITQADMTGMEV